MMKTDQTLNIAIMLLGFLFAKTIQAQERPVLEFGDMAPPLSIQEWLRGNPVTSFDDDLIYVIEFSGTWCGPCKKVIPLLNALQKEYNDKLRVISIYVELATEKDTNNLDYIKGVTKQITTFGDSMNFTIAVDIPQKTTSKKWGVQYFPLAFIVQRGVIFWKGDPNGLRPIMKQLIATGDAKEAIKEAKLYRQALSFIINAHDNGDHFSALKVIDSLIETSVHSARKPWLYYLKFKVLAGRNDQMAYRHLRSLLNENVSGLQWSYLAIEFWNINTKNRDYVLEQNVLDKAISEIGIENSAYLLYLKGMTFAETQDYQQAVEMCLKAINYSDGGSGIFSNMYKNQLAIYNYLLLKQKRGERKAMTFLKKEVNSAKINITMDLIDAVLLESNKVNAMFAVWLIDKRLKNTVKGTEVRLAFLSKKAKIFSDIGYYSKAVETCRKAIDEYSDVIGQKPGKKRLEDFLVKYESFL